MEIIENIYIKAFLFGLETHSRDDDGIVSRFCGFILDILYGDLKKRIVVMRIFFIEMKIFKVNKFRIKNYCGIYCNQYII